MNFEQMKLLPEKDQKSLFDKLTKIRGQGKATNYSSMYGVGAQKLSRELNVSVTEARKLIEAYWKVNWSVLEVSKNQYVKTLKDGSLWVYNPVSGFYYSLRYEKDIWSTINQSTGVYCFDTWVAYCKSVGVNICLQYHDELLAIAKDNEIDGVKEKLLWSIKKTNEKLKLNVSLGIDIQIGKNYAECH